MFEVALEGCRPAPLARYLKAVGVLRLVSEQVDRDARGRWLNDGFVLSSALDRDALVRFFLDDYAPTPIVAPWNGGSGFHPKDNRRAIEAIGASDADRWRGYRTAIAVCRSALDQLGLEEKPAADDKPSLLKVCRNLLPDGALAWFDAALVLTGDGPKYPPLLGTGGNDGRLDFTNNFMQRLVELIDADSGTPEVHAGPLARQALFAEAVDGLVKAPIGQFSPTGAGGPNASAGFDGDSQINPWDFILMLEGAIAFASAVIRRMEQDTVGALSYPFAVRQVGVGYGSASSADEKQTRGEMWLPLWSRSVGFPELRHVLAEGRARVSGRRARTGVDFARAVATLGVDRGIDGFVRYGFQVRNGLSFLATPLDRLAVRHSPAVRLLDGIDPWLDNFRRVATSDRAPASVRRARTNLNRSVMALCHLDEPQAMQRVLVALGRCQRALDRSIRFAVENRAQPVPCLEPDWLESADDGSVEYRLAAALASLHAPRGVGTHRYRSIRENIEHVTVWAKDGRMYVRWREDAGRDVVPVGRGFEPFLRALLQRRVLHAGQGGHATYPERWRRSARLGDIADFIDGRVDDRKLEDLFFSCILLDWARLGTKPASPAGSMGAGLGAAFGLLKLGLAEGPIRGVEVRLDSRNLAHASRGDMPRASLGAARRLRANGLVPAVTQAFEAPERSHRIAAALLFPLARRDLERLADQVLRPPTDLSTHDQTTNPGTTT